MKVTVAVGLLLLALTEAAFASENHRPNYSMLAPCKRPEHVIYAGIYATSLCGKIPVYENRATRRGRKIDLYVMVIRARELVPKPDPIFFLAGGPGQSATDVGPAVFDVLSKVRKDHDVVLVDQRGTGKSNSLACDLDSDAFTDANLPLGKLERLQLEKLKQCLAHFHADPALYTTPIAMDDLNQVRHVLGFHKIDLYGISYGTRAALVYMRRHGNTVRSAILDSVAPLTMAIPAKIAVDAQHAFNELLSDCAKDVGCHHAFPDLDANFQTLLAKLRQHPEALTLTHPRTGAEVHVRMDAHVLTRLIRSVLYSRTLSSLLPLALTDATHGNFQPIVTLGYTMASADRNFSIGMMASVLCSEDMTRTSRPDNTADFYNGIYATLAPICRFWPKGTIPADYFDPVKSTVPTLLIAGELDPVTPPRYAKAAAATLADSKVVIVPGVGHSASLTGCLPNLIAKFIQRPQPRRLDAECVDILKRPAFFTSPAGTATIAGSQHD